MGLEADQCQCNRAGYVRTQTTLRLLQKDETRNRQILERIPAGRWGEPDDLAGAAVFLSSRASDYVHGHLMVGGRRRVDGTVVNCQIVKRDLLLPASVTGWSPAEGEA
jgi:NAD(P)-dependent dehydrogenase (short-subunit alcohol dehydrogenase family)